MREIEFRCWDSVFNEYSKYHNDRTSIYNINKYDRFIFEQYTGLKDKEGNKVFEGDIIEIYDLHTEQILSVHEIIWGGKHYPAFDLKPSLDCEENGLSHLAVVKDYSFAVVGNIHEKPEFLK